MVAAAVDADLPLGAEYLVLYDGHCGFCHRATQFILPRDKAGRFHFAPLQSRLANDIFKRHARAPDMDTFILVSAPGRPTERLDDRYAAALRVARGLGGIYALLGTLGMLIPRVIGNVFYEVVARNRYRIAGKAEACLIPPPEHRARFIGLDDLVA